MAQTKTQRSGTKSETKAAKAATKASKATKKGAGAKAAAKTQKRGAAASGRATAVKRSTPKRSATPRAATKVKTKAKATAATNKRGASKARRRSPKAAVDRTTKLSEELFESVEAGQRAAIQAVRKFVDTVEQALPLRAEGSATRQEVVDSAMEMADRLVHTQYDFLRNVVHSAAKTLGSTDEKK